MTFCLTLQTAGDDSGSYISGDNSSDYRKGGNSATSCTIDNGSLR